MFKTRHPWFWWWVAVIFFGLGAVSVVVMGIVMRDPNDPASSAGMGIVAAFALTRLVQVLRRRPRTGPETTRTP